jgi:replicative DNA helicase
MNAESPIDLGYETDTVALFNLEIEQAILGVVLTRAQVLDQIEFLRAEHFHEGLHQRIYQAASSLARAGRKVSTASLKTYFENDAGMAEMGGTRYLARCAAVAALPTSVVDHARILVDLWQAREGARVLDETRTALLRPDVASTAASVLEAGQAKLNDIQADGPRPKPEHVSNLIGDVLQNVQDAMNGKTVIPSTGSKDLDAAIGGLDVADLILMAGRPGMGKTARALSLVRQSVIANPAYAAVFFSLEMPKGQLILRMACEVASTDEFKIPYSYAKRGQINQEQLRRLAQAQSEIQSLPIYFDDTPGRTVASIAAECRRLQRDLARRGIRLGLVVIDHLRKIKDSGNYRNNANKAEGEKSNDLKNMAKELGLSVMALVQLNRNVEMRENKRPNAGDLRDSGEIEEDADIILFPYRDYYYKRKAEPTGHDVAAHVAWRSELERLQYRMEMIVEKNRQGESTTLHIGCDMATNRFWDLGEQPKGEGFI